jgi:uncharacterized protein (UPF0332 family)
MDGRDFLPLAENWARGGQEAEWRSAVSRAYYAAFHVARSLLRQCQFRVPRADQAHAYLAMRLSNAQHPDVEVAGRSLGALRQVRNRADYDVDRPFPQATAIAEVQIAKDVVQILEAAALDPVKTQITDAMKSYERDVLQNVTWHA